MKTTLAIMGVCSVFILATLTATAQVGLEIHGLYAFEVDGQLGRVQNDTDDGYGGGAALVFRLTEWMRLAVGADYIQTTVTGANKYDITLVPLTAAVRVGIPIQDVVFAYVGGGAGWSLNDMKVNGRKNPFLTLDDGLIYYGCVGAEFRLGRSVSLLGEFRYVVHEPTFKLGDTDLDFDLGHLQLRAGLGLWF